MKKYIKYWRVILLVLVLILSWIYSRPRKLERLMHTLPDKVEVEITEWNGATPNTRNTQLSVEAFNKVIEILSTQAYVKSGQKINSFNDNYYTLTFYCHWNDQRNVQALTLNKGGFISINKKTYDFSSGVDQGKVVIQEVYKYIHAVLNDKNSR